MVAVTGAAWVEIVTVAWDVDVAWRVIVDCGGTEVTQLLGAWVVWTVAGPVCVIYVVCGW